MSADPKVNFIPKVNFELPKEIGPLLEQTVSASIAETRDASFELEMATQEILANSEQQLALVQADAKEVAEKLWSATTQNIEAAFGYALKLARANNAQDFIAIQVDFIKMQAPNLMKQTADLSRSFGKLTMHS